MKKPLAYKSSFEILATALIILFLVVIYFFILEDANFLFNNLLRTIQIILLVLSFGIFVSIIQLIILSMNPKIMLEYDDDSIYYTTYNKKTKTIRLSDIQNIYTKRDLRAVPFIVYSAIVIVTEKETYFLKHMAKMKETKEFIQSVIFQKEQK